MENDFLSTSEARKQLSDLVNQVKYQGRSFKIGRHGKVEAMLIPVAAVSAKQKTPDFDKHVKNVRAEKNKTISYNTKKWNYEYQKLAKKYNLDLIILFGSHASGKVKPNSDIDIAVKGKRGLTPDQEMNIYGDLAALFGRDDIDIVNLNRIHNVILRYEIFFGGKLILEKTKNLFSYLKSLAFFEYHDFAPYLNRQSELNQKRLNNLLKHYHE